MVVTKILKNGCCYKKSSLQKERTRKKYHNSVSLAIKYEMGIRSLEHTKKHKQQIIDKNEMLCVERVVAPFYARKRIQIDTIIIIYSLLPENNYVGGRGV